MVQLQGGQPEIAAVCCSDSKTNQMPHGIGVAEFEHMTLDYFTSFQPNLPFTSFPVSQITG